MAVHIFVGPTLPERAVRRLVPSATIHRPVRHGDLLSLGLSAGDTVVIVDGYYHQAAPVRHKEILHLLATGVTVIGCSSMGALRAAELHRYGMIGQGVVFGLYRDGIIDADDEVAVAHGEGPEYERFSLPLVNLRYAARLAAEAGCLSQQGATALVAAACALPYTARSWGAIAAVVPSEVADLRAFLAAHPEHADRKAADAEETLSQLGSVPSSQPPEWALSPRWRNRYVTEWAAEFAGTEIEGFFVTDGAAARYRQIYHDDFPRQQRQRVLDLMTGATGATPDEAISVAAASGVTLESLSDAQRANWLTAREAATLPAAEALTTILVRSHRPPHPTQNQVQLMTGESTESDRHAVAECLAINAEVATWAPGREVDLLRFDTLRDHLTEVWQVTGYDELRAAARDRGFPTVGKAVAAVRPFYLRSHFAALVAAK